MPLLSHPDELFCVIKAHTAVDRAGYCIVHCESLVLLGGYIHNEIEIFSFPGISYIHDEELLRTLSSPDGETVA